MCYKKAIIKENKAAAATELDYYSLPKIKNPASLRDLKRFFEFRTSGNS